MLSNTFAHIPSIGPKAEQAIWDAGIYTWDDFPGNCKPRLSPKKITTISEALVKSKEELQQKNPSYFEELLKPGFQWRFFSDFRDSTAYMDIETTGEPGLCGSITTIALYDGSSLFWYVNGENLNDFVGDIKKYKVIVTYNGKCFDVPFIEKFFSISLRNAHIDLRYILASLGYKGGLKSCEANLGIDRGDLAGVDGFFAVMLWNDYKQNGNEKALETLLAYNIEDTVNLELLMVRAYNMKLKETPFYDTHILSEPHLPEIPFKGDLMTINRLGNSTCWY